jgi:ribose-phosphate pyrophosphokinase
LNAPLAIIDKRREEANVAEVMNVIGKVKDRNCLVVDDLIDTAGTLVKGVKALLDHGAASVSAYATHAVLSGPAVERIERSQLKEVIVTNSIPLFPGWQPTSRACERYSDLPNPFEEKA